jgi:hypothetical protein
MPGSPSEKKLFNIGSTSRRGRPALKVVISGNRKIYNCEYCDYSTWRSGNFRIHQRRHTGDKPFLCGHEGCTYASSQHSNLKIHRRIHQGIKPFKCLFDGCSFASVQQSNLKAHEKRIHRINTVGMSPTAIVKLINSINAQYNSGGMKRPPPSYPHDMASEQYDGASTPRTVDSGNKEHGGGLDDQHQGKEDYDDDGDSRGEEEEEGGEGEGDDGTDANATSPSMQSVSEAPAAEDFANVMYV